MKKTRFYSLLFALLLFVCIGCGNQSTQDHDANASDGSETSVEETVADSLETSTEETVADSLVTSTEETVTDSLESDAEEASADTAEDPTADNTKSDAEEALTDTAEANTEEAPITPPATESEAAATEAAPVAPETVTPVPAPTPSASALPPCPYPTNIWLEETTEYGLKIYVLYSTHTDIGSARWNAPIPGNSQVFDYYNSEGDSAFTDLVFGQQTQLHDDTGVFHGMHFVYPVVKIGNFAEGTIYKISAGGHFTNIVDPATGHPSCPNFGTGLCQPGTIN